jgi:hypothetical protein
MLSPDKHSQLFNLALPGRRISRINRSSGLLARRQRYRFLLRANFPIPSMIYTAGLWTQSIHDLLSLQIVAVQFPLQSFALRIDLCIRLDRSPVFLLRAG